MDSKIARIVPVLLLGLASTLAEGARAAQPAADPQKPAPVAAAPAAPAPQPAGDGTVKGTVLETKDAGTYTYLRIQTADGEMWAAVSGAKVAVGSQVTVAGSRMDGFESKTLGKKFDKIVFGALVGGAPSAPAAAPESPALPPGHVPLDGKAVMAQQHAAAANAPVDAGKIEVARAEGPDGRTVAELFAQRASLKGKTVAVRGKVVKFTPEIMGKNWIHLRDGSGSREKKDDDLTVTTSETAAVGSVVVIRGTVQTDRDLGSGYNYAVIVEEAKVSK